MPDVTTGTPVSVEKEGARKGLSLLDESAAHQLVGGVMAHQGDDG